jgi:hypothetical protein
MGVSDASNLPFVAAELQRLNPRSILDVGVGFGKWGVVAREYLEAWQGRFRREQWRVRIEGIEIFEGYRNPIWAAAYDQIHIGNASQILNTLGQFDVGLICDVIEHIEKPTGRDLINQLLAHCQTVILTTPSSFWPQGEEHGNASEKHLCLWRPEDFRGYSAHTVELGATFAAVIRSGSANRRRFRMQKRLDHGGITTIIGLALPCAIRLSKITFACPTAVHPLASSLNPCKRYSTGYCCFPDESLPGGVYT